MLRVGDNGNGIPPEMTERIFQRRLDGGNGHGLGSQIIRWVMDHHRGLIRFATAEGVGTLIELWFPRLVPPRPAGRSKIKRRNTGPSGMTPAPLGGSTNRPC